MTPAEKRSRRGLLATAGVIVLLGLMLGVTAALGGLRRQPDGPLKTGPGHPVDVSLFRVVPLEARMSAIKEFGGPPKNAVVVRARVTNVGDRSQSVSSFLNGVAAEPSPGSFVDADGVETTGVIAGEKTDEIHPRLPIDVRMVWALPEHLTLRNVTVAFRRWSFGQSFTTDEFEWTVGKDSPIVAEVTFPVPPAGPP